MILLTILLVIDIILHLYKHIKQYFMINQEFYLNRNNEEFFNEDDSANSASDNEDDSASDNANDNASEEAYDYNEHIKEESDLEMPDSEPETEPDMS